MSGEVIHSQEGEHAESEEQEVVESAQHENVRRILRVHQYEEHRRWHEQEEWRMRMEHVKKGGGVAGAFFEGAISGLGGPSETQSGQSKQTAKVTRTVDSEEMRRQHEEERQKHEKCTKITVRKTRKGCGNTASQNCASHRRSTSTGAATKSKLKSQSQSKSKIKNQIRNRYIAHEA